MQKAAEAMGCVFVYGLIPRDSLRQALEKQARRVALNCMSRSNQMMRLEQQELSKKEIQKAIDDRVEEILHTLPRNFWDER
jgi:predicted DNA-binding mobile mystery protein A